MLLCIPYTSWPSPFLVTAAEWEAAAQNVPASTRVVIIRTGIVLARDGGVLARMLPIFELFAGQLVMRGRVVKSLHLYVKRSRDVAVAQHFQLPPESVLSPCRATAAPKHETLPHLHPHRWPAGQRQAVGQLDP